MDFESLYGEIGRGFIHVHHLVPISSIGESYDVNPATDPVPVCPNCHNMLHKKEPPYTIEELKKMLIYPEAPHLIISLSPSSDIQQRTGASIE